MMTNEINEKELEYIDIKYDEIKKDININEKELYEIGQYS